MAKIRWIDGNDLQISKKIILGQTERDLDDKI
jgi:hypothetical protein